MKKNILFIILFIISVSLLFLSVGYSGIAFQISNTNGLHDISGDDTEKYHGERFIVATGEDVESKNETGFIVLSAGKIESIDDNKIKLDQISRIWVISKTTKLYNKNKTIIKSDKFAKDDLVTIKWLANNENEFKTTSDDGAENTKEITAISIRKGGMRYKFADKNGKMILQPFLSSN